MMFLRVITGFCALLVSIILFSDIGLPPFPHAPFTQSQMHALIQSEQNRISSRPSSLSNQIPQSTSSQHPISPLLGAVGAHNILGSPSVTRGAMLSPLFSSASVFNHEPNQFIRGRLPSLDETRRCAEDVNYQSQPSLHRPPPYRNSPTSSSEQPSTTSTSQAGYTSGEVQLPNQNRDNPRRSSFDDHGALNLSSRFGPSGTGDDTTTQTESNQEQR